jgi:hypothetical protein
MYTDHKLTSADLSQWIENDEGLYHWRNEWTRHNKGGTRAFIAENRTHLVACIESALNAPPAQKTWRDYAGV